LGGWRVDPFINGLMGQPANLFSFRVTRNSWIDPPTRLLI